MIPHHHLERTMYNSMKSDENLSAAGLSISTPMATPRSDPSLLCKYKSGKCCNRRATKRNGQLHTLCHFHRVRQNEHQRKSDRKHRMVNVARRAKLGSIGAILTTERRVRRTSLASLSPDEGESTPSSPMGNHAYARRNEYNVNSFPDQHILHPMGSDHDQDHHDQQRGEHYVYAGLHPHSTTAHRMHEHSLRIGTQMDAPFDGPARVSPIHWRSSLAHLAMQDEASNGDANVARSIHGACPPVIGTPTGRLPPISFLTQQVAGKTSAFQSPSNAARLHLPPPSSFLQGGDMSTHHAGKMA